MTLRDLFHHRVFTFSNFLSFSRIILLVPLWYLLWGEQYKHEHRYETLAIGLVMIATDFFDGFLARKLGQETPLGQYLDPIADKIAILGGLYLLYLKRNYPLWILLFIFLREIFGSFFGMYLLTRHNILGKPNYWGKAGVFFISLSAIWYLMEYPMPWISDIPVIILLIGGIITYSNRYVRTIFNNPR